MKSKETYEESIIWTFHKTKYSQYARKHNVDTLGGLDREAEDLFERDPTKLSRAVYIPKNKRGHRRLTIPSKTLKKFLRRFNRWLYSCGVCTFNVGVIGCVRYRRKEDIANSKLIRDGWLKYPSWIKDAIMVRMDIKEAFNSITAAVAGGVIMEAITTAHRRVSSALRRSVTPQREMLLRQAEFFWKYRLELTGLLTANGCLPTGYPTSPTIFNLALKRFDYRMAGLCDKSLEWRRSEALKVGPHEHVVNAPTPAYFRYLDDIILIMHKVDVRIVDCVKSILNSEGFELNNSKTKVIPYGSGWSALGISLQNRMMPNKKFRRKLRSMIHEYRKIKDREEPRTKELKKKIEGMLASVPKYSIRDRLAKENNTEIAPPGKRRYTIGFRAV
jgi:hypothetical protein